MTAVAASVIVALLVVVALARLAEIVTDGVARFRSAAGTPTGHASLRGSAPTAS